MVSVCLSVCVCLCVRLCVSVVHKHVYMLCLLPLSSSLSQNMPGFASLYLLTNNEGDPDPTGPGTAYVLMQYVQALH